ncbi:cysteine desulfurase NifS, partial [candidate division WWE3 bacterium CG_4_10_14_0_2_um_filter_42_8]
LKPSHVLLGMGIPPQIAHSSIRFSLSYETTKNEVDYVIAKLPAIIANIRKMSPYGDDVSQKMV